MPLKHPPSRPVSNVLSDSLLSLRSIVHLDVFIFVHAKFLVTNLIADFFRLLDPAFANFYFLAKHGPFFDLHCQDDKEADAMLRCCVRLFRLSKRQLIAHPIRRVDVHPLAKRCKYEP